MKDVIRRFLDKDGNEVDPSVATAMELFEYDEDGTLLRRSMFYAQDGEPSAKALA